MSEPSHVEHGFCSHCGSPVDDRGYSKAMDEEEAETPEEEQLEQPSDDDFFKALDKGGK